MSDERANNYFITHLTLEKHLQSIPDIPCNKKIRNVEENLSTIFRYKWECEKAKTSMEFWQEHERKIFLNLRDKILKGKKPKKKVGKGK